MHGYVRRAAEEALGSALARSPAVCILGPRQCGKSTLAREFLKNSPSTVHLDLQDRKDVNKLNEPELFLEQHRDDLVCLDEIQRLPDFFSVLRAEIDRDRRPGRFLILGSASRDLIRQSNESLAGRIAYVDLTPFLFAEVKDVANLQTLWVRGGFPDSLLAATEEDSVLWRRDFVRTFLERDIPVLGLTIPSPVMERLWRLLAHYHGQTINYSKLAAAADICVSSLKKYLAILDQTYMIRLLPHCEVNLKKRLIKSPKVFIRDSGVLHSLLDIDSYDELLGNPAVGPSWEGVGMENVIQAMPDWRPSFLRTSNGAEVDLVMERGQKRQMFEFKASKAPKPSRGFFELVRELAPEHAFIVAPVDESYDHARDIRVTNLRRPHPHS